MKNEKEIMELFEKQMDKEMQEIETKLEKNPEIKKMKASPLIYKRLEKIIWENPANKANETP